MCNADLKFSYLQTSEANNDLYIKPLRESGMESTHSCLFLAAANELVNASSTWRNQKNQLILDKSLKQCKLEPQLFNFKKNGKLVLMVAKVVDDFKTAADNNTA